MLCHNFNSRRDNQKISYERHDYESCRRKEPTLGYVPKNDEKMIQAIKG